MTTYRRLVLVAMSALVLAIAFGPGAAAASAEEAATWALEQPSAPPPPPGVAPAPVPVALGAVGDIAFWEPAGGAPQANRGLLITHGNGTAIPPGVWAYNGVRWHELAEVCGATDGSVAWSGPEEFWTVSDGRPGQSAKNAGTGFEEAVPLEDNTLCRFAHGQVADSYAHLAFEPDSYRQMSAAACVPPVPPAVSSDECWFGGALLEAPAVGSFHLEWNGTALEEHPDAEGHAVQEMRQLAGALFESVTVLESDPEGQLHVGRPPAVHQIAGGTIEPEEDVPLYGPDEPAYALEGLRLSAAEGALWVAAGPSGQTLSGDQEHGQVTVARRVDGIWEQVFGPRRPLPEVFSSRSETEALTGKEVASAREAPVSAVAAEPGSEDAWVALAPRGAKEQQDDQAVLVHIDAAGQVLGVQTLPAAAERARGVGPTGSAVRIVCPAREDCWMATSNGWLYHLASSSERAAAAGEAGKSEMSAFPEGLIISERPRDQGVPQEVVEAPPANTSGEIEENPDYGGTFAETKAPEVESSVAAPLLTDLHSRLIHGTTLELSFRLAVKAQVRLVAKRHQKLVASTPMHTFAAGKRKLLLKLNRRDWPTKLSLQTHPLAPLPTTTTKEAVGGPEHGGGGSNTVSTSLHVLPALSSPLGLGRFP